MYGQALGWSYVIPPGMQRLDEQHRRQALECRHVQERILIPCCICSWHALDLRISIQIALPRPESHCSCSQMKAYYSDRSKDDEKANTTEDEKTSAGLTTTEYSRRTWQRSMWLNGKSLPAIYSSKIYRQHRTTIISFGAQLVRLAYHRRITTPMFESASTVAIYPSLVERVSISSLLHRCKYTSTRLLHLPRI